jgi:hypothetical protein
LTELEPAKLQIDSVAARLREDAVSHGSIQLWPIMFGAWTRVCP